MDLRHELTRKFADQCVLYINNWMICHMTIAYNDHASPAVTQGDSGGPTYHYYSDGVSVRGIIGAGQSTDPHRFVYTPAWLLISMWVAYPRMA